MYTNLLSNLGFKNVFSHSVNWLSTSLLMPMEEKLLFQGSLIYPTFPLSSLPTVFYVDFFFLSTLWEWTYVCMVFTRWLTILHFEFKSTQINLMFFYKVWSRGQCLLPSFPHSKWISSCSNTIFLERPLGLISFGSIIIILSSLFMLFIFL